MVTRDPEHRERSHDQVAGMAEDLVVGEAGIRPRNDLLVRVVDCKTGLRAVMRQRQPLLETAVQMDDVVGQEDTGGRTADQMEVRDRRLTVVDPRHSRRLSNNRTTRVKRKIRRTSRSARTSSSPVPRTPLHTDVLMTKQKDSSFDCRHKENRVYLHVCSKPKDGSKQLLGESNNKCRVSRNESLTRLKYA